MKITQGVPPPPKKKKECVQKNYLLHSVYVNCERFEPRSHFKSRLSLIVQVNVVLNRTIVVDSG